VVSECRSGDRVDSVSVLAAVNLLNKAAPHKWTVYMSNLVCIYITFLVLC